MSEVLNKEVEVTNGTEVNGDVQKEKKTMQERIIARLEELKAAIEGKTVKEASKEINQMMQGIIVLLVAQNTAANKGKCTYDPQICKFVADHKFLPESIVKELTAISPFDNNPQYTAAAVYLNEWKFKINGLKKDGKFVVWFDEKKDADKKKYRSALRLWGVSK